MQHNVMQDHTTQVHDMIEKDSALVFICMNTKRHNKNIAQMTRNTAQDNNHNIFFLATQTLTQVA